MTKGYNPRKYIIFFYFKGSEMILNTIFIMVIKIKNKICTAKKDMKWLVDVIISLFTYVSAACYPLNSHNICCTLDLYCLWISNL